MQAKQELLLDFIADAAGGFTIPPFQRAYSWEALQCDELWLDALRAARGGYRHFTGTLLYTRGAGASADAEPLCVVDGQQRLTTVMLLLSAFADYLQQHPEEPCSVGADDVRALYLKGAVCTDGAAAAAADPLLVPSPRDREAFRRALAGEGMPAEGAQQAGSAQQALQPANRSARLPRAIANRDRFRRAMEDPAFSADDLWRGLRSLTIISAELSAEDDAQAIFESFNSKGVPLTSADLIRNYILTTVGARDQARLYTDLWQPAQGLFGDDPGSIRMNNALHAWLSVRCRSARSTSDAQTFAIFKRYFEEEFDGAVEDLMREIYGFCSSWAENYRFHAVKKYKTYDWAILGAKTLVSDRPLAECANPESRAYYTAHYGVDSKW